MSYDLKDASVIRGNRAILATVSLRALPGKFTALCGPNGAGKTTALSLLAGSVRADKGQATLDGLPLHSIKPTVLARRRGVLQQAPLLTFPFLVHEVVAMGRTPHEGRTTPHEDADIVTAAMARTDVLRFAERNYLTLSGGERQRVQLARVLAQVWDDCEDRESKWLLLDEPTSALDLKYQLKTIQLFRDLADEGWGIIAVLHDLRAVKAHADHVILFSDGKVAGYGAPETVLTNKAVQDAFDLDQPIEL